MNRSIDSRSDLYSLGVTFYRAADRAPAVRGQRRHRLGALPRRAQAAAARARPSAVPAVLSAIVLKLLAKAARRTLPERAGPRARSRTLPAAMARDRATSRPSRSASATSPIASRSRSGSTAAPPSAPSCRRRSSAWSPRGTPELVLVSGSSGIGKSSLVHELHRPIVGERGLFVTGKFEQYKRDIPYFTVVQAFREVMLDILAESAESIAAWRQRIAGGLGAERPAHRRPHPARWGWSSARSRRCRSCRSARPRTAAPGRCASSWARSRARSIRWSLFLDDLQWADPASLELLVDLLTHPSTRHLLLVGAYRDNEVGPAAPAGARARRGARGRRGDPRPRARAAARGARRASSSPTRSTARAAEAEPLAHLVREKTGGNPFFVIQFLTALHRQGLIAFDRDARRWRWDLARIRAQGYTDNVVELMVGKLHDLPPETQEALELAACLGASMDADTLARRLRARSGRRAARGARGGSAAAGGGRLSLPARSRAGGGLRAHPRGRAGGGAPAHRAGCCSSAAARGARGDDLRRRQPAQPGRRARSRRAEERDGSPSST